MDQIYLDHNATTPVDPEVVDAMLPYLSHTFGNASSLHYFGREAKAALERAREEVAAFISCDPGELYFTSGGTESDNMAVLGAAFQRRDRRRHAVYGATEHHAVMEACEYLVHRHGFTADAAPVDSEGFVSPRRLARLVTDQTAVVSIMHANNETGTIQDLKPLVQAAHEKGAWFHTDAVQSCGKIEINVRDLGLELLSLTGHKIYGPKGTGALFIRDGIKLTPLMYGGSHEKKRRPGTENVAGAVGLAKALEIARRRMEEDWIRLSDLADFFIDRVLTTIPHTYLNGTRMGRIPQVCNISFTGVEGESILLALDLEGVACSSGSACTSGATEPSHVLVAMGKDRVVAQGAIRFSLGRSTNREQLDYVLAKLPPIIERLRSLSPLYQERMKS
ncbi:MAG TPA: cysteine desulfurase family protein [candidate division Zixibacteria bacterium]|nr:cysteine desulfurase [candidate division Zixibacteria bacterium]MDD4917067.1 cysteine desulfurase family protein [candidate division Zixibacteria bacterium]MDM7972951.1 cysteine desulfurase family protein [candidate division Zixibacteria bacterium]HOD65293.1 cysteine desulfurase family protein [candidate division Zixibacteria bacterium]HOZ07135.1 cysteine desulfurase family protein [candidate division Zixibacteria bacterium]